MIGGMSLSHFHKHLSMRCGLTMESLFNKSFLFIVICGAALGNLNGRSLAHDLGTEDVRIRENQCPSEQDISPCFCLYDSISDQMDLDCSAVLDEAQLSQVFAASFPSTTFRAFRVQNNTGLTVLEAGVFQDVSFQEIRVEFSALEAFREGALDSSFATATTLKLTDNQIFTFPFSQIESFQVLQDLSMTNNDLHFLQIMKSDTLKTLRLAHNPLSSVTGDTVQNLTAVEIIDLSSTLAAEVFPGGIMDGRQ